MAGPPAKNPLHVRGGVSTAAYQIIESIQPYKAPYWSNHPLLVLDRLAKINKHRSVPTGIKGINDVVFTSEPGYSPDRYAVTVGKAQDDDAELIFTPIGVSGAVETGTAYLLIQHAPNEMLPPIKSLTTAAQFIREQVVLPIEQACF
jgi:hypothetical protein